MSTTWKPYFKARSKELELQAQEQGIAIGYYLVRESDKARFYISKVVDTYALEKVADKVLSDKTGYDYYVDYSFGADLQGKPAWMNLDLTDRFL